MASHTTIAWAQRSWNPLKGCSMARGSELGGCERCYACRLAATRLGGPGQPYEGLARVTRSGPRWTGEVRFVPEHLEDPLKWQAPSRIFTASMSDPHHEHVPWEWLDQIAAVIQLSHWHEHLLLTKRAERLREYWAHPETEARVHGAMAQLVLRSSRAAMASRTYRQQPYRFPPANLWLGVSVEDPATAERRIPDLLATNAAVKWVSYEPALASVNFHRVADGRGYTFDALSRKGGIAFREGVGLDWVVVGGESGPGARAMKAGWAKDVIDQCRDAGVPVFMKQAGTLLAREWGCRDRKGEDVTEFPEAFRVREYPETGRSREEC